MPHLLCKQAPARPPCVIPRGRAPARSHACWSAGLLWGLGCVCVILIAVVTCTCGHAHAQVTTRSAPSVKAPPRRGRAQVCGSQGGCWAGGIRATIPCFHQKKKLKMTMKKSRNKIGETPLCRPASCHGEGRVYGSLAFGCHTGWRWCPFCWAGLSPATSALCLFVQLKNQHGRAFIPPLLA